MSGIQSEPSSFRDPSGQVFYSGGEVYRRVGESYREDYDLLFESGLYEALTAKKLLIPHEEVEGEAPEPENLPGGVSGTYKTIKPERLEFVSYPYEWCFGQLRDAALATLRIQSMALEHGMWLKDATAYNIQFHKGRPCLIDTLSFVKFEPGKPWPAYRQFCQHFLAPLLLGRYCDVRLAQLSRVHIDGIPLDLASRLLPRSTWLRPTPLMHLHMHARAQRSWADREPDEKVEKKAKGFDLKSHLNIAKSLEYAVKVRRKRDKTEWGEYYSATNYSDDDQDAKKELVGEFIDAIEPKPKSVWDIGGNTGRFSRAATERKIFAVCFDMDHEAVEQAWAGAKKHKNRKLLPLVLDLSNPSGAIGWDNRERKTIEERGPAGCVMALALIHHLCVSNNVPLERAADFFARLSENLIIEFVPKEDSQVRRLLATREDIFPNYTEEGFEAAFSTRYEIAEKRPVGEDTCRTLYRMKRKDSA